MKTTDPKATDASTDHIEESRRRFLKKAGKLAIYTPPAMALMMQPSHARFLTSGGIVNLRERLRERREDGYPELESLWQKIMNWLNSRRDD